MTHVDKTDGKVTLFIAEEPPGKCEECGKVEETRPYGKGGKQVCFDCGMADEKTAMTMFAKRLSGE